MTRIKICGITNIEDALYAAACGADALGFIFFAESKRFIAPERALEIIRELPPFVTTVGVFVNESLAEIERVRRFTGVDAVQLHGDETADFCRALGGRLIKAVRIGGGLETGGFAGYPVHAVLFDTFSEESYGGTGEKFNWDAIRNFNSRRVILSGGLTPQNVQSGIRAINPYAVDVSSGVEEYPGKKNREKIKKFCEAVRNES
ncbi:MAG: phosphoribosylanthranilate isomerase [Deltaproteobacteria bacterium]